MKKSKIIIISLMLSVSFCLNAFAGEWKSDNNGWRYQEDNGSCTTNTWKEINGKWYYFNEGGYMLSNTVTPDGYSVNESGEWVQTKETVDTTTTVNKYVFSTQDKWVNKGDIPEGEYLYYPGDQYRSYVVKGSSSPMSNFNYVKLYKDDIVNAGTYIPTSDVKNLDISKEGMFLVGRDIKAGTYNLTPTKAVGGRAECMVFNSIPSSKDTSTEQKNIDQDFFVFKNMNNSVTVKDGQYVQIIECTANFVRP
jgi:hypothetical protein